MYLLAIRDKKEGIRGNVRCVDYVGSLGMLPAGAGAYDAGVPCAGRDAL